MLAFGWRMSVSKLNKKLNYCLLAVCIAIEIFELVIFIWSWQFYPNQEDNLYRYTEAPQMLFGACRDSLNGIITATQRNSRILMGFILFWTWFVWPMFAVAMAEIFENWHVDSGCDVLSWMMKMFSFSVVVFMTHPLNLKHDHCFNFAEQFVHARYVQSGQPIFDNEFDDSEDELETPKTEMQAVGSRYQTRKE